MYRPPVKVIDAGAHAQRRRTEADAESAAPLGSIYAQARTIRSLGLTLGLTSASGSGSAGSRLRAALEHADEDSDDDTGATSVNPRTLQRLARHKPWRNSESDADMRQAIQQQLQTQNPVAAASSRPASAIRSTIAARSAQAAAHVAAAASRAAQAQPAHPATPPAHPLSAVRSSAHRLSALEASIRTLQVDPASWHRPPSSSSAQQRPQRQSLFANDAAAEETKPSDSAASLSRPLRAIFRPASAASHHPMPGAAAATVPTAAGRSSRPASAAIGAQARHTRLAKRSPPPPPYGASAASAVTPRTVAAASSVAAVAAPPPCIVRSFLRLTAPLATRVQLTQMKPLPFVMHSRTAVQFVDESDVTPSPTLAALSASSSATSSSRAAAASSAKVRYNPSLPPPPTPSPVFHFDGVFGPAPLSRGDAAEVQARELFEAVLPVLELPMSEPSQQPQPQPSSTVAVVSMGVAGSGASETLFGGLGSGSAASSLSPRSSLQHPAGVIARFLHSAFAAAEEMPRGGSSSLQVTVSLLVLLPSDSADSSTEGSAIRRSTSALDLFRSELLDPMTGEALSPPRWTESRLTFDAVGAASGMVLRRFTSAAAACDAIGLARDIWNNKGAPILRSRPGSFVVSVHLTRRDRFVDAADGSVLSDLTTSSVLRFFDVPACLREWSLAQMDMLTTSGVMQPVQLVELNEMHAMMGLRQMANATEQAGHRSRRLDCHPRSSCFARLLLPALNAGGRLVLLTHIAASGTGAMGPRAGTQLARHLCSHFGRPRDPEREAEGHRPVDGASLLSVQQPWSSFLVDHIHPAVQRAAPRLYAPLFDIVMDYLGAGSNLSVRLKAQAKLKHARGE